MEGAWSLKTGGLSLEVEHGKNRVSQCGLSREGGLSNLMTGTTVFSFFK